MVKILKSFAASVFLWANRPNWHENDNEPHSIRYAVDMWRPSNITMYQGKRL